MPDFILGFIHFMLSAILLSFVFISFITGVIFLIVNAYDKKGDSWQRTIMAIVLYITSVIILVFVYAQKAQAQVPLSQFPYIFNLDKDSVQLSQHAFKDDTYKDALVENILYTCDNLVIKVPKYIKKNAPLYFGVPSKHIFATALHQFSAEQLVGIQIVLRENDYVPCKDFEDGLRLALGYFNTGYKDFLINSMFNDIILVYTLSASAMFTHETIKHNIVHEEKYGPKDKRYAGIWIPLLKLLGIETAIEVGKELLKPDVPTCVMPTTTTTTTNTTQCIIGD